MLARIRDQETRFILNCTNQAECCAIVGLSNMGKSTLVRSICTSPSPLGQASGKDADETSPLFVYIDFNLMVEMTEQAFYELILRSIKTAVQSTHAQHVIERVERAYHQVIESRNSFLVPLGFNEGIIAVCEELNRQMILMCDEFDEPFMQIDQRVFLNLRALRDRYIRQLGYVVTTGKRLEAMRHGNEISEFCELFAHHTLALKPLSAVDTQTVMADLLEKERPTPQDLDFAIQETGGHPGLLVALCRILNAAGDENTDYRLVRSLLDSDHNVQAECIKLWNNLDQGQQHILIDLVSGQRVEHPHALVELGIIEQHEGQWQVLGRLFGGFVRRQRLAQTPYVPGVHIDVDSGQVQVNGRQLPDLTDLEFRLLLLLYGRMGKLCDKYQIVQAVWGEDYIDQVDDARIEKLVSRLRRKLEPDTDEPCFLQTVRGRGYRLVEA